MGGNESVGDVTAWPPARPGRLGVDSLLSGLLLVVVGLLMAAAMMMTVVLAMYTDPCAYQACGDPRWDLWATRLTFPLVAVAGAVFGGWAVYRLAERKPAAWVAGLGCAVQVAVMAAAYAAAEQSGPVT